MNAKKTVGAILLLFFSAWGMAQNLTIVRGNIINAKTKEKLQYVSVVFEGGNGVVSNEEGRFYITTTNPKLNILTFSFVGYKSVTKKITPNKDQELIIELELTDPLSEVVVSNKKKGKYRNKNNPAVELINKVIENKEKNRITAYDYVQYEQYEKLNLSLANTPEKLRQNFIFGRYKFLFNNMDTLTIEGKGLLPIYIEEKLSHQYFSKNPERKKIIELANKKVNYGDFLDNKGLSKFLNTLYADINIYDNNITILTSQFLSPISDLGPTFYRYYLWDTIVQDGIQMVKLYFTPRNPTDLLFRGTMFITLDGNYAVQKINMGISKNANLNWTRQLRIKQDFEKGIDNRYHVVKSSLASEFSITKGSGGSMYGDRIVSFRDFIINKPAPDSIYNAPDLVEKTPTENEAEKIWQEKRHEQLTTFEQKTYTNIDTLRTLKSFKRMTDFFVWLFSGYFPMGPKYEIGNTNTFYSFNPVEGFRLRFGGRTTPAFNKNFYIENYLAYGFKDKQFKYSVSATYSFNGKSIYAFPLNYLKLTYQYDTRIPGQELQFVQEDNFFLSFKRGVNDRWLYNRTYKAEYVREFGKNLSYTFGYKHWEQTPAGSISYIKGSATNGEVIQKVTTSELSAELRWAPNEVFYQGKNYRIPIFTKYPIFKIRYIAGIKGLLGGEYTFHNLMASAQKRFYLSQLGFMDASLEGAYIFGKLPFPLLNAHRANQTYAFQPNSYNLMNFLEFISDHYVAANVGFYFNGFFFNKIPLFKKLKWREVAGAKVLFGGIREENDPAKNSDLFKFPVDNNGKSITYTLNNKPYVEINVGIANIFKVVRVDVIRRFTYLDLPNVSEWGIRTRIRVDF